MLSAKGQLTVTPGTWSLRHLPALAARRLKDACRAVFPEDVSGFLIALLTGDKQGLSYSLKNDLSRSGIYHVVAVSGMHVSLLAGLIMTLREQTHALCSARHSCRLVFRVPDRSGRVERSGGRDADGAFVIGFGPAGA